MPIIRIENERDLGSEIRKITANDVAFFGAWRIIRAAAGGFWLAGGRYIFSIEERRPVAQIRKHVAAVGGEVVGPNGKPHV